jgi:hypothetical protein
LVFLMWRWGRTSISGSFLSAEDRRKREIRK